jgi:hypothetical protein
MTAPRAYEDLNPTTTALKMGAVYTTETFTYPQVHKALQLK